MLGSRKMETIKEGCGVKRQIVKLVEITSYLYSDKTNFVERNFFSITFRKKS
jgi:hypothetical protein